MDFWDLFKIIAQDHGWGCSRNQYPLVDQMEIYKDKQSQKIHKFGPRIILCATCTHNDQAHQDLTIYNPELLDIINNWFQHVS